MPSVHFNDNIQVKYMYVWATAHRLARKGKWIQMAIDRCHFNNRIDKSNKEIGYIFQKEHRDKMKIYIQECKNKHQDT